MTGTHRVQHAAQAEQVAAMIDRLALGLFGDMNIGVPAIMPDCVRLASSAARARPKSVILTARCRSPRRMFAGLMSRWIKPCWWAAASPSAICTPIRRISLVARDPVRSMLVLQGLAGDVFHDQVGDRLPFTS